MNYKSSLRVAALIVIPSLSVACGERSLPPSPANPTPPGTSAIVGISIVGPTSVAPGTTATYSAIATRANGSTEDVTARASWIAGPGNRFPAPGRFEARFRGESTISVTIDGFTVSLFVYILEPGTFRLTGRITDPAGRSLWGVTIAVVAGTEGK